MSILNKLWLRLGLCLLLVGCGSESTSTPSAESSDNSMIDSADIVFLTRDGCANTPVVLENLKAATRALDGTVEYDVIDQATLSTTDPRVGYPTPTILWRGADIFGSKEPVPPFPAPS